MLLMLLKASTSFLMFHVNGACILGTVSATKGNAQPSGFIQIQTIRDFGNRRRVVAIGSLRLNRREEGHDCRLVS